MKFGSRPASEPKILPPYICMYTLFCHLRPALDQPGSLHTCTSLVRLSVQEKLAYLGPIHTYALTKVSGENERKYFIQTSVFVSFSPIHTKTLENDQNG